MEQDNQFGSKRVKLNSLQDRIQRLEKFGMFKKVKISGDGYNSFYHNPRELENSLKRANSLYKKAVQVKKEHAIKHFYHAYVLILRMIVANGFKKEIMVLYHKIYVAMLKCCADYMPEIRNVFLYANYVITGEHLHILFKNMQKTPNQSTHEIAVKHYFSFYKNQIAIRDKGFKIVSMQLLEREIKSNLPEDLNNFI
ncbi:hypothetical protein EHP00_301 [Ecytonucleospora hepatopenaei]|uniref:Uncharacterized protein n=1 Tax=Ecytonucleospora hepatopenaei TaxID=646526 RepID=A0A1W0E7A2_9MICR|nr:hypothetical protein EHP00_301 [Ecytonucleospora hepatopenaei]